MPREVFIKLSRLLRPRPERDANMATRSSGGRIEPEMRLAALLRVDSVGLGDRRGCNEGKELLEREQWLAL
jgi:hypothetical protein